jgi:hypothetical protein
MRVDNMVNQPPPTKNRDNEATSCSADLGHNRTRAELPAQPNRTRANAGGPSQGGNSAAAASGNREIIPHRDPGGGGSDGGSSNHGAKRRAGGGGDRGGRDHANSHASGASQGGYDTRQKIEELRRKKSATTGDNDGFPAFSPRLCNLLLPVKFKPLGITKYDAKQDPIQWLRCYARTEASVRSAHHLAEATTLLPGVLDLRHHRLPARRHPAESRCYWKNLQVGSRTRRPQHRLQATHSHQVTGTSRLHGGVAGEPATYSNRAPRALGDVLRRLTQPRGRRCRSTPDLSNGRTTQICPANLLEGLKQRSQVRSSATRAPPRSFTGHQAATSLRRLRSGHQPSQQVLGPQQGEHGRLLPRSLQAREQVLWSRVPPHRPRQQRCQRTSCRRLVLLALKYQRVSSSTSFTRHPSRSRRHRPLS